MTVGVHQDSGLGIFVVNLSLREPARRFTPRQPAAGAMIDRETTLYCISQRAKDVTEIFIAAGNQNRMARLFPNRAAQKRIAGGKGAGRAFAMHPNVAEFRMPFLLHQVVANLINQFELSIESFAKGFGNLFEDNQTIQNRVIAAGRDRVQVIAIVF